MSDTTVYAVIINHEEQYSIWPAAKEVPAGWKDTGHHGNKDDCLKYVSSVWKDMRPHVPARAAVGAPGDAAAEQPPDLYVRGDLK